jgi:hypothetical protein
LDFDDAPLDKDSILVISGNGQLRYLDLTLLKVNYYLKVVL